MKKKVCCTVLFCCALSGCTAISVNRPEAKKYTLSTVCIERNDRVLVRDMVNVIQAGFLRHKIETVLYDQGQLPATCQDILKYTARRKWDIKPFMSYANLSLLHNGLIIGSATYRHRGGLAFNKWAGTEKKLGPVIDDLLADY